MKLTGAFRMRKNLKNIREQRQSFTGTFVRYGKKSAFRGPDRTTLLLKDIKNSEGGTVTEHIWFTQTKGFGQFYFHEGDLISFDARVKGYWKGYNGRREDVYKEAEYDYKLGYPSKVKLIKREAQEAV